MWYLGFVEQHENNWNIKVTYTIFHQQFVCTMHEYSCGPVYFHFPQQFVGTCEFPFV